MLPCWPHTSPNAQPAWETTEASRASVSNTVTLSFYLSPPLFFCRWIYCTNIGRTLERLKQYKLGLITTVNVPQTWSTDQCVFICTINTNTRNPVQLFGGRPSLPEEGHWQLWAFCQHAAFSFAIFMWRAFNIYSFRFDTALLTYSDCFGFFRDLPEVAVWETHLRE